jgi:hypothetical protein
MSMRQSEVAAVGDRSVHHEFRVTGKSPYGGRFDHGWRRQGQADALAHAQEMATHADVSDVRFEHRIVDCEVLVVVVLDDAPRPDTNTGSGT